MPKGKRRSVQDTKTVTFESGNPIEIGKHEPVMGQGTGAVRPGAAVPPPPAPDPFQEQVVGLLQSLTASISALSQRVDAVEQTGSSQFKPMPRHDFGNEPDAHDRYQLAEMSPLDAVPRSKTVPVTADGLRIPEAFIEDHPAMFGPGSKVRLNLDAVPHGRSDGKTRGELMMAADAPNGAGEVIDRSFLSKVRRADGRRGVWKYRCQFPRSVMPGSNEGTVTLHEPELIPA